MDPNHRHYIFDQGQSIGKLHTILRSNRLTGYLKGWLSILFEIALFLIFLALLVLVFYIPLDPIHVEQTLSDSSSVETTVHDDQVTAIMIIIKLLLFIASLMPLILMMVLGRNRRKRRLLMEAFEEVELMQERFDKVKTTLS